MAPAQIAAADIITIDDGIAWARGIDGTVSDDELVAGITTIGALVPEQNPPAMDNDSSVDECANDKSEKEPP